MQTEGELTRTEGAIEDVADGQKMIIFAILLNITALFLRAAVGNISILVGIAAIVLAVAGLLKLVNGLGYSTPKKVILVILLFIPLISLLTLVILSGKATEKLRAAGYKVGLLGARKP